MNTRIVRVVRDQLRACDQLVLPHGVQTLWRVFSFNERTGVIKRMFEKPNLIPYQGADVLARVLSGDSTWFPAAMFFEFENTVGSPTIPTPERDEDISYYLNDLSFSATKDYMRMPLVIPAGLTSSDDDKYESNQATFFAITSGNLGVHGRTFDHTVNSKVYGVALAATPTPDQYTQDKLFSRSYSGFSPIPKEDGHQIGAQYLIRFQ